MTLFGRLKQGHRVHIAYTLITAVYAMLRKSLIYIVGLRGVEPRTSRLSGPLVRKQSMASYGEFAPVQTSRFFRRERERAQKPPPARTQRVHAKADGYEIDGQLRPRSLTNLFRRIRRPQNDEINISGGFASTAQERQAERVSRARSDLRNFLYVRPS